MNRRYVLAALVGPVVAAASGAQEGRKVEVDKATLDRDAKGGPELVVALKGDLPDGFKKSTRRLLFAIDGSGFKPKSVTDVAAAGSITLRAGHGWSLAGGYLSARGKPTGFLVDLGPLEAWPTRDARTIAFPLNTDTLFDGMPTSLREQKGELFVGFVEYGRDGNSKVAVSNTVSVKVGGKDPPPKKKKK